MQRGTTLSWSSIVFYYNFKVPLTVLCILSPPLFLPLSVHLFLPVPLPVPLPLLSLSSPSFLCFFDKSRYGLSNKEFRTQHSYFIDRWGSLGPLLMAVFVVCSSIALLLTPPTSPSTSIAPLVTYYVYSVSARLTFPLSLLSFAIFSFFRLFSSLLFSFLLFSSFY